MRKKKPWIMAVELAVILLLTAGVFMRGRQSALVIRQDEGCGGEYLLLLLPVVYYIWKRIAADWLRDFLALR